MRLRLRYIRFVIPAALLCLGLSSCIYDDGTGPDAPGSSSDLMVSFTLRLERGRDGKEAARTLSMAASRSSDYDGSQTWDKINPPDPGNEFDNRLLKEHFHMLLLEKGTNEVVGKMEHDNMDVLIYDPYEDYTIMEFWGVLDTELSTEQLSSDTDYKVMIFANGNACSTGLGEVFSGGGMTFSHIGQPGDKDSDGKAFDAIPMWGVAPAKLAGIKPGRQHDIGEVSMLRSMAKIIVDVDAKLLEEENKDVLLTSLTLEHYNTEGNILPGGWSDAIDTKSLNINSTLNATSSSATTELKPAIEKDGKSVTFYVPEYANDDPQKEFLLKVGYSVDGELVEEPGKIHIGKYTDGQWDEVTRWPIVRNHIYHYTITSVGPKDNLRFRVKIARMEKGGEYVFEYE